MKFKILISLFLILFLNNNILAIEFNVVDNFDFNRYPTDTGVNVCEFNFKVWISDPTGILQSINSGGITGTILGSNATHLLYSINLVSSGVQIVTLTVQNGNYEQGTTSYTCNCFLLKESSIDFIPVGQIYFDSLAGYSLIVKRIGVPSYVHLGIMVNNLESVEILLGDGIHSQIQIPYFGILAFTSQITINFQYQFGLYKSIIVSNYLNLTYQSDFQIIHSPVHINNSLLLMGKELVPAFTFSVNSQSIQPSFASESDVAPISIANYRAIYESNGKTIYMSSYYFYSSTLVYIFSFYAQNLDKLNVVYPQNVDLIDAPYTLLSTASGVYSLGNEAIIYDITINSPPGEVYNLNRIKFSTYPNGNPIEPPFGFGPSSSSNNNREYQFMVSVPYFKQIYRIYYYIFGQQDSGSVISSNTENSLLYEPPQLKTYEFQFISNTKYIFKANILSYLCGVTGITFDGATYKRISQFRIGGDSLDGFYEIPIDLEKDIGISQVGLIDLCNNQVSFYSGSYLSSLTLFDIPFLNNWNNVDLTSIKDVSFLYNNIDVSKSSVTNTIYFNYPDYDIKNAPFSLRLPYIEAKGAVSLFPKEYYGFWNSSINKFQIEFPVQKNSRVGKFDYSISLGIGGITNRYISSAALSNDAQLYIENSNFDGIGPVITNIVKVITSKDPIDYLGWQFTISDPINGFDYGFITVMGSLDNSIYKFKLTPNDLMSGNITLGLYNVTVYLVDGACVNQDYIITKVILYDTAGQFTKFERDLSDLQQFIPSLNNPFYLISDDPNIIVNSVTCSGPADTTPPSMILGSDISTSVNVGSSNREVTFSIQATDDESGINYLAQGPVVYLIAENFEIAQCISILDSFTSTTAIFKCSMEIPVGLGSEFGKIYVSVYGIINNHGLYKSYTSSMLNLNIATTFSSTDPVLFESGLASSNGGNFYFGGKNLDTVQNVYINYTETNYIQLVSAADIKYYGTSMISISVLKATKKDFYVYVESNQNVVSNKLLVSPVLQYEYIPTVTVPPLVTLTPLPTNAPQKCLGTPLCGGPTKGYCIENTGCKCYSPYIGNDCLSRVLELPKPPVNSTKPSTIFELESEDINNSSNSKNVHFKSLVSIYSLREIGIDNKIINEYSLFNQSWVLIDDSSNGSDNYYLDITNKNNNNQISKIFVKLEWFNSSKTITFANENIEMNANSMKYTIEISNYQFKNQLSRLQLVIYASFSATSNKLCSFKEFGETSAGDNSNYLKIQIDNKSLYTRLIKRAVMDESKIITVENTLLDNSMNPIETSSESQSYIGINIPIFSDKIILDPDFSVLLDSSSVDNSYSNSKCPNKSRSTLTKSQLAGIIVGGVVGLVLLVFVLLVVISKSFKYKSKGLLKLNLKMRSIYDK